MEDDKKYPKESILVHEIAPHVMNIGVRSAQRKQIQRAYEAARAADPRAHWSVGENYRHEGAFVRAASYCRGSAGGNGGGLGGEPQHAGSAGAALHRAGTRAGVLGCRGGRGNGERS